MFRPSTIPPSHDDLFVDRYEVLVRMALQITRGDHDEAVDLVQDAFVRFTLTRPDLSSVRQIDAYFFTMLRNMHLSRSRRMSRQPQANLSIVEWDSAETGIQSLDHRSWLQARDELRAACRYGCLRRLSSKSGSVFLLRFFHGYVPSEIGRLLRTTPRNVDEWLRLARTEARLYLTQPERVTFLNRPESAEAVESPAAPHDPAADLAPAAFVRELQQQIFSHRHARCSPRPSCAPATRRVPRDRWRAR